VRRNVPRALAVCARGTTGPILLICGGLAVTAVFLSISGYDAGRAFRTLFGTWLSSPYGFSMTLTRFVPILLLAYAFAVPQIAGRSNIGGDGQFMVGGIAAVLIGISCGFLPPVALVVAVLLGGAVAGGLWGGLAGLLLHRFAVHEVLSTMLGNFIALGLVNWVATSLWPDPASGHP
jgi:ABC-type uncharacterized transport system permease subunit